VLDADPRRVKKLKIYLGGESRDGRGRELPRRPAGPVGSGAVTVPPATLEAPVRHGDLPVSRDPPAKLSPDLPPSKSARRP
jgi:hypothetical protein